MKVKCPICGCEEFYTIDSVSDNKHALGLLEFHNTICGVKGKAELHGNFVAMICKNCGKVEIFAKELLKKLNDKYNHGI